MTSPPPNANHPDRSRHFHTWWGSALNILLTVVVLAHAVVLFTFPLFDIALTPWTVAALLLSTFLLANVHWGLVHDACHGSLFYSKVTNQWVGRVLSVVLFYSFEGMRLGHLLHHRYSRTPLDRPDHAAANCSRLRSTVVYYRQILGGDYLSKVSTIFASIFPLRAVPWWMKTLFGEKSMQYEIGKQLKKNSALHTTAVIEHAIIALELLLLCVLYQEFLWMVVAIFMVRAFPISLCNYLPHFGTPLNQVIYAENLQAPRWVAGLMLYGNLHGIHHRYPKLPWYRLEARRQKRGQAHTGSIATAFIQQLRGPFPAPVTKVTCSASGSEQLL